MASFYHNKVISATVNELVKIKINTIYPLYIFHNMVKMFHRKETTIYLYMKNGQFYELSVFRRRYFVTYGGVAKTI